MHRELVFYVHSIEQPTLLFLEMANWRSVLRQKMVDKPCIIPCLILLVLEELHWPCTTLIRYVCVLFTAVVVISEKMLFYEIIICVNVFRVNHAI